MSSRDIPVYLSLTELDLARHALDLYAQGSKDDAKKQSAYDLSEYLRDEGNAYHDAVQQARGRKRFPRRKP